jgi:hypothetical protein
MNLMRIAVIALSLLLASNLAAHAETPLSPDTYLRMEQEKVRVPGLESRIFTAEHWWQQALPHLTADKGFSVEQIGSSAEGRPLRHVQWGDGPVQVLLWSQMHGDESTATMALADLFAWLGHDADSWAIQQLRKQLTLHFVPILNPDGAARFQRRNAQGIDINRDAAALATPEARALKSLRDRINAEFGFNLHDQRPGYRAGDSDKGTAIALLAPPADETASLTPARQRAIGVAASIAEVLAVPLQGHLARWDETFNPRAFGDMMQRWGTSTVLIEAGGIEGDPQKQALRRYTFVAMVTGLRAIADGSYAQADSRAYSALPENGDVWPDLLIRGATVVNPGAPAVRADVLVNFQHSLSGQNGQIKDIGDLSAVKAREVIDASGLFVVPLEQQSLATDTPARFALSKDPRGEANVWTLDRDIDPAQPRPAAASNK